MSRGIEHSIFTITCLHVGCDCCSAAMRVSEGAAQSSWPRQAEICQNNYGKDHPFLPILFVLMRSVALTHLRNSLS